MTPRSLAVATLLLLTTLRAASFNVADSIRDRFADRPVASIEGVWQWTDGAVILIETDDDASLAVTLLESPDPDIETPVAIGHGRPGAKKGIFVLDLDSRPGSPARGHSAVVATVAPDGRLSITPRSGGLRVRLNIWQALPYLGRISVGHDHRPDGLDGAWRIYPPTPNELNPVIL